MENEGRSIFTWQPITRFYFLLLTFLLKHLQTPTPVKHLEEIEMKQNRMHGGKRTGTLLFLVVHEWCNWFQKRCLPFVQLLIAMHCPSAVHGAYFDQHAHLHLSNVFCASVPAMIPYVYTDPWPWTLFARKWRWQLHTYNMQICPRA